MTTGKAFKIKRNFINNSSAASLHVKLADPVLMFTDGILSVSNVGDKVNALKVGPG